MGLGFSVTGCVAPQLAPPEAVFPPLPNPITVATRDPYVVWETLADVIDDYFDIEYEEPIRIVENAVTEGQLETYPKVAATVLEPWRRDSVGRYERWFATLQSVRRRALVRAAPSPQGFQITVEIYKELEDVPPEEVGLSPASFRNDSSLTRVTSPSGIARSTSRWVPIGRDFLLEQRILNELASRLSLAPHASFSGIQSFPREGLSGSSTSPELVPIP